MSDEFNRMVMPVIIIFTVVSGCSPTARHFPCLSDEDCADDEICLEQRCTAVECKQDGDCDQGEECVDHTCVEVVLCKTDADCEEPTPLCDTSTGRCVACLPDCAGRECGPEPNCGEKRGTEVDFRFVPALCGFRAHRDGASSDFIAD